VVNVSSLASVSANPSLARQYRPGPRLVTQEPLTGPSLRNVLIVGAGKAGRSLAAQLYLSQRTSQVCGFVDERAPVRGDVHGRVSDLSHVIREQYVDEIVITPPCDQELVQRVAREARRSHVSVAVVPDLYGFAPRSVSLDTFGNIPILRLHKERLPAIGLVTKRILDVLVSALVLLLASPLLAILAAWIKLDSPGVVLYRSLRVGKKGYSFVCFKLRTMITGADHMREELSSRNERKGPFFKIENDPRITRLGHWLPPYSLDELPQF